MNAMSHTPHGIRAVLIACLFAFAGCTTTSIKPEFVQKPAGTYDAVVVGDLKIEGETWQHLLPHFKNGLIKQLKESKAFGQVLASAKNPSPAKSVVISGRITKIDRGSAAARILIGFGAGASEAEGTFEIHNTAGAVLARFGASESYAGGAGIGGWDMVQMEELLENLGAATARSVARWSRGESLEPSSED